MNAEDARIHRRRTLTILPNGPEKARICQSRMACFKGGAKPRASWPPDRGERIPVAPLLPARKGVPAGPRRPPPSAARSNIMCRATLDPPGAGTGGRKLPATPCRRPRIINRATARRMAPHDHTASRRVAYIMASPTGGPAKSTLAFPARLHQLTGRNPLRKNPMMVHILHGARLSRF